MMRRALNTKTNLINSDYSYQFYKADNNPVNMRVYSDWFSQKDVIFADSPSDEKQSLAVKAMVTLVKRYDKIQELRNKINHGNGIKDVKSASQIIGNMTEFLSEIKKRSLSAGIKLKEILKKEDIWH